ncbi:MAG TPA: DUF5677 domain-containing protein [Ignavibacteria bacterium]
MKEKLLTLNDFDFPKTEVNVEAIKKFDSEEPFMSLAIELFKEVCQITSILSCACRLDEKNEPRKWTRNEAALGGLMVRISKLQIGCLEQICQKRLEIAMILFRCLHESLINMRYLLNKNTDEIFNEYIEYSLREEKRLLNTINQNIDKRGNELHIETRMKRSIDRTFKISSFYLNQVDENKWKPWGEKIYERAKSIGMEDAYIGLFGLPSHTVHGNWQDLITYHLKYENGEFSPKTRWGYPRPQPVFVAGLLSAETNRLYLEEIIQDCPEKNQLIKLLDDIILRIRVADELHEQFLQKESNEV